MRLRPGRRALGVEELERRDVPATFGIAPGFPPPLAVSGPLNGQVTLFAPSFPGGQFNPNFTAVVTPFPGFAGTVRTAFGDVNGDTIFDLVAITGPGAPARLAVLSGTDFTTYLVAPLDPFGGNFTGGGFVSAGDIDNDGRDEFVASPDQGGGPRVVVYSLVGTQPVQRRSFFGIEDPGFRGGARVAVGNLGVDPNADLVVAAGFGGGPRVAVYTGLNFFVGSLPQKLIANDFFAFPEPGAEALRNGVYVAVGDVDADGFGDLIFGAGPGGGPRVYALSGRLLAGGNLAAAQQAPVASFFSGDPNSRGGVRVAAKPTGTGTRAEIVTGSGEGQPSRVRVYFGQVTAAGGEPRPFQEIDPYTQTLADGVYVG